MKTLNIFRKAQVSALIKRLGRQIENARSANIPEHEVVYSGLRKWLEQGGPSVLRVAVHGTVYEFNFYLGSEGKKSFYILRLGPTIVSSYTFMHSRALHEWLGVEVL